jgi:hypothetical protein
MSARDFEILGPVGPRPTLEIPQKYITKWAIVIPEGLGYPKPLPNDWPNLARYLTPDIVEVFFDADDPDTKADCTAIMELDRWKKINHLSLEMKTFGKRQKDGTFARRLGAFVVNPLTGLSEFTSVEKLLHEKQTPFRELQHKNKDPLDFRRCNIKPDLVPDPRRRAFLKHKAPLPHGYWVGCEGVILSLDAKLKKASYQACWLEDEETKFGTLFMNLDGATDGQQKATAEWNTNMERLVSADLLAPPKVEPKRKLNALTKTPAIVKRVRILPQPWSFPGYGEDIECLDWDPLFENPVRIIARGVVELAFNRSKTQTMIMNAESWVMVHKSKWHLEQTAHPRPDGSDLIKIWKLVTLEDEKTRMRVLLTDVISDYHSSYAPARHLNGNLFDNRLENLARGLKENTMFNPKLKSGWPSIDKVDGPGVERPHFRANWMNLYGVMQRGEMFEYIPGNEESEQSAVAQALKERFTSMPDIRLSHARSRASCK